MAKNEGFCKEKAQSKRLRSGEKLLWGSIFETSGVHVQLGERLLTRILSLLKSKAIILVNVLIAPFEAP